MPSEVQCANCALCTRKGPQVIMQVQLTAYCSLRCCLPTVHYASGSAQLVAVGGAAILRAIAAGYVVLHFVGRGSRAGVSL